MRHIALCCCLFLSTLVYGNTTDSVTRWIDTRYPYNDLKEKDVSVIIGASALYGVPLDRFLAIIAKESSFKRNARGGRHNAMIGMTQISSKAHKKTLAAFRKETHNNKEREVAYLVQLGAEIYSECKHNTVDPLRCYGGFTKKSAKDYKKKIDAIAADYRSFIKNESMITLLANR